MPDRDRPMTDLADCLHHLDLCPDCDGLRTITLNRIPGVCSVTLGGDASIASLRTTGPIAVYVGPVPGVCPNTAEVSGG